MRCLKAIRKIRLSLADEVLYNILNEDFAVKLVSMHMMKSILQAKTVFLTDEEGGSFNHLNEFNKIIFQLVSVDAKFEDGDKSIILLSTFHYMSISLPLCAIVRILLIWKKVLQPFFPMN